MYSILLAGAIAHFAVDIPYWDEWELFNTHWLKTNPFGVWIFNHHNEHRVVPTHVSYLVNYWLFGLDFKIASIFNLPLFLAVVTTLWLNTGARLKGWWGPLAALGLFPLASNLLVSNHMMSGQNCVHFCLLGFFLGSRLIFTATRGGIEVSSAFDEKPSGARFWLGVSFWILSIYSYASGIPAVWAAFLAYLVMASIKRDQIALFRGALAGLVLVAFSGIWFLGFHKPPTHPDPTFPWQLDFWAYVSQMVATGFGFSGFSYLTGTVCMVVLGLSVIFFGLSYCKPGLHSVTWSSALPLICGLGLLATLSTVALGRAGMGIPQAKSERYGELTVGFPLIIITLLALAHEKLRSGSDSARWLVRGITISAAFWILLLPFGLYNDFGFRPYKFVAGFRSADRVCARELASAPEKNPQGICERAYPGPIVGFIQNAKDMNASFLRTVGGPPPK